MKNLILFLTLALFASCSSSSDESKQSRPSLLGLWQIVNVSGHYDDGSEMTPDDIEHHGLLVTPSEFLIVHSLDNNEISCCEGFFNWSCTTNFTDIISATDYVRTIKGEYKYYDEDDWYLDEIAPIMIVESLTESELVIYETYPDDDYEAYITYKKISNDYDIVYTPVNCE